MIGLSTFCLFPATIGAQGIEINGGTITVEESGNMRIEGDVVNPVHRFEIIAAYASIYAGLLSSISLFISGLIYFLTNKKF